MKKNKGKIVILSAFFWPVKPEYYPDNMAKILNEEGYEVTAITQEDYADGSKIERPNPDNFNGIKIIRCRSLRLKKFGEFFRIWFPKIPKADAIHSCGGYRHIWSFLGLLKRKKAKYIISPFYPMRERKGLQKFFVWLIDKTFGKYHLRKADLCLAETEAEKSWLKSLGVKNIEIIPNPISDDLFKQGRKGNFRKKYKINGKMIFCLANHTPIKNFEDLIKIMKDINVTLVIGGKETEYTKKCRELAKRIDVEKKIVWAGLMNLRDKKEAYADCDIFILPSLRESLGTVLLEAMAQEKPIIGTNKGGVPYIVPDKFCLYEPGDIKTLKEKIEKIFKDKKLSRKLGERGFKKAEEYSYSTISKKYLKIIEKLIKK